MRQIATRFWVCHRCWRFVVELQCWARMRVSAYCVSSGRRANDLNRGMRTNELQRMRTGKKAINSSRLTFSQHILGLGFVGSKHVSRRFLAAIGHHQVLTWIRFVPELYSATAPAVVHSTLGVLPIWWHCIHAGCGRKNMHPSNMDLCHGTPLAGASVA